MTIRNVECLAAFATVPSGGNPAGVWVGEILPDDAQMQRIAAEVGYSETAFISPASGYERRIRYFSPLAEVSFCGHATIASGVVLGRRHGIGTYRLATMVGDVPVTVTTVNGRPVASLRSVEPKQAEVSDALLDEALATLKWQRGDLDRNIPAVKAYAGAWHLVIAVTQRDRLARLDYDFDALKALMHREELTTLQLLHRASEDLFHARNPFPPGGVVEDPATGASAAALGGYLRNAHLIEIPSSFVIRQGDDMGRPSIINVHVPESGGIDVSGTAVDIPPGA